MITNNAPTVRGKVTCANWDSFNPQPMYADGRCIGTLMPRATQAQLGYGIQGWSRPLTETRKRSEV